MSRPLALARGKGDAGATSMILSGALVGGEESKEAEASSSVRTRGELLTETRLNAEADAIRHAEDLLEREFPIVATAERMAESRLALLRSEYSERHGELETERGAIEQAAQAMETRLQRAEAILRGAGVPETEIDLPPAPPHSIHATQAVP